jgi:hypothetical protein
MMPCGGIYPIGRVDPCPCLVCGELGTDHFCDEWDCYLHGRCVYPFLKTLEGQCVLDHGHTVIIDQGEGVLFGPIAGR